MSQPSTDHQRSGTRSALHLSRDTAKDFGKDFGKDAAKDGSETKPAPLQVVADALDHMRYGVIQLTVHDGKLVQLDITERRRFAS
ncbi:YezD family protein [Novosphingobium sp.]|uniref:YezD family protein n=1 Tax=Novosphingobium sp. TaxID=1874826 RepID=UPI0028A78949|nr:YezD family protein [Novosphingobium sp.]